MTKRNILTAAVAALGALAIAFTLVVSSPPAAAQPSDKEIGCNQCFADEFNCAREEVRTLWMEGELGNETFHAAMKDIGAYMGCRMALCNPTGKVRICEAGTLTKKLAAAYPDSIGACFGEVSCHLR